MVALGTDGFGRSEARAELRDFFEVDARYIALATLQALSHEGAVDTELVTEAMVSWGIDPDKKNPYRV
jgi:pyruvate dehydrogenase E1 component